jgi:hypothetical protein
MSFLNRRDEAETGLANATAVESETPGDDMELLVELTGSDAPKLGVEWTHSFDPAAKDIWLLAAWKA